MAETENTTESGSSKSETMGKSSPSNLVGTAKNFGFNLAKNALEKSGLPSAVSQSLELIQKSQQIMGMISKLQMVVAAIQTMVTTAMPFIVAIMVGVVILVVVVVASKFIWLLGLGIENEYVGIEKLVTNTAGATDSILRYTDEEFAALELEDKIFSYEIIIRLKDAKSAEVTSFSDQISYYPTQTSYPQLVPIDNTCEPINIPQFNLYKCQYKLDFNQITTSISDTAIINTVTISFNYTDKDDQVVSNQIASAYATVAIGNVSLPGENGNGCWPTNGLIIQGPYATYSHTYVDGIDILGDRNQPIIAPFDGEARFNDFANQSDDIPSIYGNSILLDTGETALLMAHLSRFSSGFVPPNTYSVRAGEVLGYQGDTGSTSDFSFSVHLHYEIWGRRNPPSVLQRYLPEYLELDPNPVHRVPRTQRVSLNTCGVVPTLPLPELTKVAQVGCFSLYNKDKDWTQSEIDVFTNTLEEILSFPEINNSICGISGTQFNIVRADPNRTSTSEGCNFDGTGESGGEWVDSRTYNICDMFFSNSQQFGVSTIWHETGHAYQFLNRNWGEKFRDFGPNYLPSYPLAKSYSEDFAESFGLCFYNRKHNPDFLEPNSQAFFRGQFWNQPVYINQCSDIYTTFNLDYE